MDERIARVIERLNTASMRENARDIIIPPGQLMSAITYDTGVFFNILLRAMGAKNILEIGMSTGFSTILMAEAVRGTSGMVITIEMDEKKIERAMRNFRDAGVDDVIQVRRGVAKNILHDMELSNIYGSHFDFVLIDADKENIRHYFDTVLPMVRTGGLVATDNMTHPPKFSHMMDEFAQYARNHPLVRSVLVPVGNGEELSVKL